MNHLSADHVAAIDAKTMRVWGAGSLSSPPSPRCRTLETA
jgi:hypothetical protein